MRCMVAAWAMAMSEGMGVVCGSVDVIVWLLNLRWYPSTIRPSRVYARSTDATRLSVSASPRSRRMRHARLQLQCSLFHSCRVFFHEAFGVIWHIVAALQLRAFKRRHVAHKCYRSARSGRNVSWAGMFDEGDVNAIVSLRSVERW